MIDFIKCTNAGVKPEVFLNSPYLEYTDKVVQKTGQILNDYLVAKYRDMRFIISRNRTPSIAGSLHMYFNEGQNYNDFTLGNLRWVINDLQSKFEIDPKKVILNNVELGLNLEVPFDPDDFINSLVTYNYTPFNSRKEKNMTFSEVQQSQYILKIYNKGLQYGLNKNILRFEVKITRMAKLEKYGIRTLADLIDPSKLRSVKGILLEVFSNITIWDDSIDRKSLNQPDREILANGYNPKYWQAHHTMAGNNSSRKLRRYQDLVSKHGKKGYHLLAPQISSKWDSLIQDTTEPIRDFTDILKNLNTEPIRDFTAFEKTTPEKEIRVFTANEKSDSENEIRVFTEISNTPDQSLQLTDSEDKITPDTSFYNLTIEKEFVSLDTVPKVCLVTGYDISMQKESSRFLSYCGIKYYFKNNPEIYSHLLDRLTKKWASSPHEKQVCEIAHSIRNSYHSKRIHTQKAIKRLNSTPALFNNNELISQQKINIANR